jgi:hypothetical protein
VDGDTAAQTYLGISIFDNDGAIGAPFKIIGRKLAPRTATYNFAKGLDIRKWAGKYLFFHFAHYTPNPTFTLSFTILALEDTLISELIPLPGSI